jgi:hypothetical protein
VNEDVSVTTNDCETENECEYEIIMDDSHEEGNAKVVRKIIIDKK